jgi:hypothetical protein
VSTRTVCVDLPLWDARLIREKCVVRGQDAAQGVGDLLFGEHQKATAQGQEDYASHCCNGAPNLLA